ncbi:MAG TPA: 1,2-phenylacetyl-CoA epoxidase subunit PaaC [Symbiobacteriaceae bacterium]|nr:1,2-phenylacetyl-CoA epoxidase subunit PaaC [Symbiobacteriaceae bacterium]
MTDPNLVALLYQLADDELVIGHRDSEWLGLAPHIEEDIAFGSIAQDEVGHAAAFYHLLEGLGLGQADDLAFLRPAVERRNAVLLERPNGAGSYLKDPQFDWGYTVARRLAYDLFDAIRLEAIASSCAYQPLAQLAGKIRREERYHLLHHATWFRRLAEGTAESRRRLAAGIERTWEDVSGLFVGESSPFLPVCSQELWGRWTAELRPQFDAAGLPWPLQAPAVQLDGRAGQHTPDLDALLQTMGEVYRTAPGASW